MSLRDLETGQLKHQWAHKGQISQCCFAGENHEWLISAAGGGDFSLTMTDVESGAVVQEWTHERFITTCSYSHDLAFGHAWLHTLALVRATRIDPHTLATVASGGGLITK